MMVNSTQHDYVTANPLALPLNNRAADGCHVSVNCAFDNHVAAESDRPLFDCAGNANGLPEAENRAVADAVDNARLTIAGRIFDRRVSLRRDDASEQQTQDHERFSN